MSKIDLEANVDFNSTKSANFPEEHQWESPIIRRANCSSFARMHAAARREMPPAKTWYFQVESLAKDANNRIKVFTGEGNELKKGRGKRLGAIREISPGGEDAHELASATQRTTLVKVN